MEIVTLVIVIAGVIVAVGTLAINARQLTCTLKGSVRARLSWTGYQRQQSLLQKLRLLTSVAGISTGVSHTAQMVVTFIAPSWVTQARAIRGAVAKPSLPLPRPAVPHPVDE